ncbi:MAG: 50S ribosomal protein L23 [Firmicutes bacterium]|nr:50S ribosomal protein L23 [Bacillota bacterium]
MVNEILQNSGNGYCFYDIVIRPLISEKSMSSIENLKYCFEVNRSAGKIQIKCAIEKIFDVKVKKVNTLNVRGRKRRKGKMIGYTNAWKKAFVTLKTGQKAIDFFNQIS